MTVTLPKVVGEPPPEGRQEEVSALFGRFQEIVERTVLGLRLSIKQPHCGSGLRPLLERLAPPWSCLICSAIIQPTPDHVGVGVHEGPLEVMEQILSWAEAGQSGTLSEEEAVDWKNRSRW